MQVTVYLDIVFFMNTLCNFMVLVSEGWFLKNIKSTMRIRYIRLLLAAAAGGAGYCINFMIEPLFIKKEVLHSVFSVLFALFFALAMVRYSFGKTRSAGLWKRVLLFFLLSFCFSGFLNFVLGKKTKGAAEILGFGGLLLFLLYLMVSWMKGGKKKLVSDVWLEHRGKRIQLKGLWDTGNQLREPCSGKAVFLVEYECVKTLFSEEENKKLADWVGRGIFPEAPMELNIRLVFYSSIGKEKGVLPAVMLEKIIIEEGEGETEERADCVAALVNQRLGKGYQMILPEKY